MIKITEMIPDMPDWAEDAMEDGQLFNVTFDKINGMQSTIDSLNDIITLLEEDRQTLIGYVDEYKNESLFEVISRKFNSR